MFLIVNYTQRTYMSGSVNKAIQFNSIQFNKAQHHEWNNIGSIIIYLHCLSAGTAFRRLFSRQTSLCKCFSQPEHNYSVRPGSFLSRKMHCLYIWIITSCRTVPERNLYLWSRRRRCIRLWTSGSDPVRQRSPPGRRCRGCRPWPRARPTSTSFDTSRSSLARTPPRTVQYNFCSWYN